MAEQIRLLAGIVRGYLKDIATLNRITNFKVEYDDAAVNAAANMAVREINFKYQPKMSLTLTTAPEYLVILGVAKYLVDSEISLKARNTITVNDGSSIINREGNIKAYEAMLERISLDFGKELYHWKIAVNIEEGFNA